MNGVVSGDGTRIAFDQAGAGPPIVLVAGAFNDRGTTAPLATALATDLTVLNPDRRGRGDSDPVAPAAVADEVDDLEALVAAAGGRAALFGYSSGAVLCLEAAVRGLPVTHLVLYDPPYNLDARPQMAEMAAELERLVAIGRRRDAVEAYQTRAVGIPPEVVAQLRQAPFWPALEGIAHTLASDARALAAAPDPAALASINVPTLVLNGAAGPPQLDPMGRAVAEAIPHAEHRSLADQTHDLVPGVLAPQVIGFLTSPAVA